MKKFLSTLIAAVAALTVCIALSACNKTVDYSVAGKTYKCVDCEYTLSDDAPEALKNALDSVTSSISAVIKNNTYSFDNRGKCKMVSMGQSAEMNYTQEGKKITIAGGNGTDGIVCILSEDESEFTYSAELTEQMKQMMSAMADYITGVTYTFKLKV